MCGLLCIGSGTKCGLFRGVGGGQVGAPGGRQASGGHAPSNAGQLEHCAMHTLGRCAGFAGLAALHCIDCYRFILVNAVIRRRV